MDKIFDPEAFKTWQDIDPEGWRTIVSEILESFFSVIDSQNETLRRGIQEQNLELVQLAAHAMKSSFANVGCMAGSKVLKRMEECAKEKDLSQLASAAKELEALYGASLKELREFKKKH